VEVKIIFIEPRSPITELIEKQEDLRTTKISNRLNEIISLLEDFSRNNKEKKLAPETSISIRVTKELINYSMAYAGRTNNDGKLLITFFTPSTENAPCYEIREYETLKATYNNCLAQFDFFWKNSQEIFLWDNEGIKYFKDIDKYQYEYINKYEDSL
jgi:hypothetical protein